MLWIKKNASVMRQMQPADGKRLDVKRAEESSLGDHLELGLLKTARAKDGRGSRSPSPGTARVASGLWALALGSQARSGKPKGP